ncbi:hypothetical protein NDU88_003888 [Pleurodeles waltl]|uniref:Uncharacterized protein n=1 Tax=Pleurodeles waltl TaxID=8319 RepID=A0AAV7LIC3_PLEWA|nr:hypothetical protein NDU88_003888 [Pleurodeles waltl]
MAMGCQSQLTLDIAYENAAINSASQGPTCPLEGYRRSSERTVQPARYPPIGRTPGRESPRIALTASWELRNPKLARLRPPQFFIPEEHGCLTARSRGRGGRCERPSGLARVRRPGQLLQVCAQCRLCSAGSATGGGWLSPP